MNRKKCLSVTEFRVINNLCQQPQNNCCEETLQLLNCINENLITLDCKLDAISNQNALIYGSLASTNALSIAAEYPEDNGDVVIYNTNLLFSSLLSPFLTVLFKQPLNVNLPCTFRDASGFEHQIVIEDLNTPVKSNWLLNNVPYNDCIYYGNYIILVPTEETKERFLSGNLNTK